MAPHVRDIRGQMFMTIARFAHANRPIDGWYFEFGSYSATTMRLAYDAFHHLFDWDYVAFDSFEGMPEPQGDDRQEIWRPGMSSMSEAEFRAVCVQHGVPDERLTTIAGWYRDTLTPETAARFDARPAAVVYVDCDLYESTVPVLDFVGPFLQRGTVIVFDDWFCFYGDPELGERRAFAEFRERNPELRFEPLWGNGEGQSFICL
ncbi:MAG TPA: TylF/MycF/NovP-related O-methyltransferase [Actinomycetota bacterium]|nr:TylF/MycF/NovP-related O-methyltransferase [Actinomycetota bacterium]